MKTNSKLFTTILLITSIVFFTSFYQPSGQDLINKTDEFLKSLQQD